MKKRRPQNKFSHRFRLQYRKQLLWNTLSASGVKENQALSCVKYVCCIIRDVNTKTNPEVSQKKLSVCCQKKNFFALFKRNIYAVTVLVPGMIPHKKGKFPNLFEFSTAETPKRSYNIVIQVVYFFETMKITKKNIFKKNP